MVDIAVDCRFRVSNGVSARELDGELVVLDLTAGTYFGLDEIGRIAWQELIDGRSPEEIASRLARDFDASEGVILADILRLVSDLVQRRLIRVDG